MDMTKTETVVDEFNVLVEDLSEEDTYWKPDEDEMVDQLRSIYDDGVGTSDIHDLVRKLYLTDNELAKQMYRALSYWISHEPDANSKV